MPAPPKLNDPLPRKTICLSDAFERYYRATAPDVSAVETELNAALPGPESLGMWRCDPNWLGCLTAADYQKGSVGAVVSGTRCHGKITIEGGKIFP